MIAQKIKLTNSTHGTSIEVNIREDIIQPGVYKDIKKKLCHCGGNCSCSNMGHTDAHCTLTGKQLHICTCKDAVGEEYSIVTDKDKKDGEL